MEAAAAGLQWQLKPLWQLRWAAPIMGSRRSGTAHGRGIVTAWGLA